MSVYLRKKILDSESGQKFLKLLISVCEDGDTTEDELNELKYFLEIEENLPKDNPSVEFLKKTIDDITEDGVIEPHELEILQENVLKIIPKVYRDPIVKTINVRKEEERILHDRKNYPPTEKQFNFIRSLGGDESHFEDLRKCSRYEVSDYIDQLLEVRGPGPTFRQRMRLKFWGKDELKKFEKMEVEDITYWIEDYECEGEYRDECWDLFKEKNPEVLDVYGPECVDLVKRGEGKKYEKLVKKDWESNFEDDEDNDDLEEPVDLSDLEDYLTQKNKSKGVKVKGSCLITLIGISISFLTLVISVVSFLLR
jgi:hypothetical protein